MPLLRPDQLEAGAVIPQCADNQFVPGPLFRDIVARNAGLADEVVRDGRRHAFHEELIRSLIYAPQVVLNRAFVFNNDLLFGLITTARSEDLSFLFSRDNETAVQALVPYLYAEKNLTGEVSWDKNPEGARAVDDLIQAIGFDPDCVRFHPDDDTNLLEATKMGRRFADYFVNVGDLDDDLAHLLMSELLESGEQRERLRTDRDYRHGFRDAISHLSDYANDYKRERMREQRRGREGEPNDVRPVLSRERIYADVLMSGAEGDLAAVRAGRFGVGSDPTVAPFVFELKKLVDLRYNTNLPDLLDRYSFSPRGFPTRSALQDENLTGGSGDAIRDSVDSLRRLRHNFLDAHRPVEHLPFLAQLDLGDVVRIRMLPEWGRFVDVQTAILDDPLNRLQDGLPELHRAFADLQVAISRLHRDLVRADSSAMDVFVSVAVSIGAASISFWLDDYGFVDDVLLTAVSAQLPERVRGAAVKLVYNVVDRSTGRISERRSWAIEVARSEDVFDRAQVEELLRSIRSVGGEQVDRPDGLAEQERG